MLLFFRFVVSVIPLFLFTSCAVMQEHSIPFSKENYQQSVKEQEISDTGFSSPLKYQKKSGAKNRDLKFAGSGYIKGEVQKKYFSKTRASWVYYILGKDLSNGKLKSAWVYAKNNVANIGDVVYAVIKNGKISSLYLFKRQKSYKFSPLHKKANLKKRVKKIVKKSRSTEKRYRKQVISAPAEEKISF